MTVSFTHNQPTKGECNVTCNLYYMYAKWKIQCPRQHLITHSNQTITTGHVPVKQEPGLKTTTPG